MLNKDNIKSEIKSAFVGVKDDTEDRDASIDKLADILAVAVVNAIKSQTISYTSGLMATKEGGPVIGTFGFSIE